nr:hypothetical protein [uncultured Prevotella sp.]
MKTITIKIIKKSVMGVVEGLSATIAQHNPEVDFETIWASDAEEAKLDIYYREAITDLENFLASFSSSTTQQFDLQALADDFTITVKTLAYWPPRLSGVLTNQIQNYLVHAIMAGWLSDFPDMPHTDYASMGASDLESIKEVLLKKDFSFAEAARKEDSTQKTVSSSNTLARQVDETVKQTDALVSASRALDASSKELNATHTEIRSSDTQEKAGKGLYADSRQADDEGKQQNDLSAEARNGDDDEKDGQRGVKTSERNPDFMSQHFHQDYTDWSGGRPPFVLR